MFTRLALGHQWIYSTLTYLDDTGRVYIFGDTEEYMVKIWVVPGYAG